MFNINVIVKLMKYVDLNSLKIYSKELERYLREQVTGTIVIEDFKNRLEDLSSDISEIRSLITNLPKFEIKVVEELPTSEIAKDVVYLLYNEDKDNYTEYVYVKGEWEKLGDFDTTVDLKEYALKDDMVVIAGDGKNSAVLKGGNNQAISEGGVALGKNNIIGLKGWYYKAMSISNTGYVYLYLSSNQQLPSFVTSANEVDQENDIVCNLKEGDICCIINGNKFINVFEVKYNHIKQYGRIGFSYIGEGNNPINGIITTDEINNGNLSLDDYCVYCLNKPDIGNVNISEVALTEGKLTKSLNSYTHAEGLRSVAYGKTSHVEGQDNIASGECSHAEGAFTKSKGDSSHTEGFNTEATQLSAHAEGYGTLASNGASHAEGSATKATGLHSHAEGDTTLASGSQSHAEGKITFATGEHSHAEGHWTKAYGKSSHVEGQGISADNPNLAEGDYSHAEGYSTHAQGNGSHAEGTYTIASGNRSHAEGNATKALGESSHAEGSSTNKASDYIYNDAGTLKSNDDIIATWNDNKFSLAKGVSSHVEGEDNLALGGDSHAEGLGTTASGNVSHTEGSHTTASGSSSHAEGSDTIAEGDYSHAEGYSTIATNYAEHASGKYNVSNEDITIHSVGIGTSDTDRKNAHEITTDGKNYIIGIGGYDGTNSVAANVQGIIAKDVATVINELINKLNEITTK